MESNRNLEKTKLESLCGGLNAMPFRTEARKCNHWATEGLLDIGYQI